MQNPGPREPNLPFAWLELFFSLFPFGCVIFFDFLFRFFDVDLLFCCFHPVYQYFFLGSMWFSRFPWRLVQTAYRMDLIRTRADLLFYAWSEVYLHNCSYRVYSQHYSSLVLFFLPRCFFHSRVIWACPCPAVTHCIVLWRWVDPFWPAVPFRGHTTYL